MKKLMIAAAIVCAAAFANAAVANWAFDTSYQPGTSTAAEGWTAVFFDPSEVSQTVFKSACSEGYSSVSALVNQYGGPASDLTDSDGYADGSSVTDYGIGINVNGYVVLFNADTDSATPTLAYLSSIETFSIPYMGGAAANFQFGDLDGTMDKSNWTAIGAPEPTSGLLMLLGMGALALRRRRA